MIIPILNTSNYYFMGARMNILMFSSIHLDYPLDFGSKKRIYNMGKMFQSMGHTVHFVYLPDSTQAIKNLQHMMHDWDSFTLIEKTDHIQMEPENDVLDACYEDHISDRINQLIHLYHIDLVWCNYIFYSKFLETLPRQVYKVIDTPEIFRDKYKIFETDKGNEYSWYSYSQEDEAKALNRADMVIAITQKDAEYFTSICSAKVETLGHLELQKFTQKQYNKLSKIGFLGGNHAGNTIAINTFLEYFYAHSTLQENIKIVVAGTVCNAIKHQHKNLKLLGKINKLEDFYHDVDLAISPVTAGTGQKIKSIEALAYGVPITSTTEGFTGIDSQEACHNLNNIPEMIHCIELLYNTPKKLEDLAIKSKEIFSQYLEQNKATLATIFKLATSTTKSENIPHDTLNVHHTKSKHQPKISIVTVCYNAGKEIERTIQSILEQTYQNIEYIIIDGASTDNTVNIIKQYEDKINYWISEPDDGIYYAMNKAIDVATGEWVNFMNAGDTFADKAVVENMVVQSISNADIYYGSRFRHHNKNNIQLEPCWSLKEMFYVMPFGHQAAFTKKHILKTLKYDTSYRLSADYDFFIRCYNESYKFKQLDFPICNFCGGGLSQQQNFKSLIETIKLLTDYSDENTVQESYYYQSFAKKYLNKTVSQLNEKEKQLKQKNLQVKQQQDNIKALQNNHWYRFGKLSRKQKIWVAGKVLSKRMKIHRALKPIAQTIKKISKSSKWIKQKWL